MICVIKKGRCYSENQRSRDVIRQVRQGFAEEMRLQLRTKGWTGVKKMKMRGENIPESSLHKDPMTDDQKKTITVSLKQRE